MNSEKQRMGSAIEEIIQAKSQGKKIKYDRKNKIFCSVSPDDPDISRNDYINVGKEDMTFSLTIESQSMIVIAEEEIQAFHDPDFCYALPFNCIDNGDAFVCMPRASAHNQVPGSLYIASKNETVTVDEFGKPEDQVRVICKSKNSHENFIGHVKLSEDWIPTPVQIIPVRSEIFSRNKGILETDVFAGMTISIIGVGSVGSHISVDFTKAGILNQNICDHDRLEACNLSRHKAGFSHIGRFKAKLMVDVLHEINPYANIKPYVMKIGWDNIEKVRPIIAGSDLVFNVPDDREARRAINSLCVEEKKPCVSAGAFSRAHAGQVLIYRPGETLCYQCYCRLLPEMSSNEEVSNKAKAERIAYSDRPVPIEPGLSTDIGPISLMAVKVGMQYLLRNIKTTLRSLDEDLVAPLYLWLNRREGQFKDLEPLEYNIDGMHVLRWYGIDVEPDPECPVCGEFKIHI